MALDIETYGKLKRDAVLYTKCSVRLISLHYGGESWFIDCDHVPNELIVSLSALGARRAYPGMPQGACKRGRRVAQGEDGGSHGGDLRSEEHTSELQSRQY